MRSKMSDNFILEQELDEIPSYCSECGKVHGPEACQYAEESYEDEHIRLRNQAKDNKERQAHCAACLDGAHSECIGQGCYCDCQVPA
jgi:hypothetical protein